MSLQRWLRKTTAWIALLAVCFGALAPTLSQAALQARGGGAGHWVQICSASGITWVRADTGPQAAADEAGDHPAEAAITCPWGVVAAGAADLPPAPALALPEAAPHPLPLARAQRGIAAAPSAHAPARAPPAVI
ncbi:MAG: DUF2946 family protein [Hydrogenophaga sp.]|uniref:DUF2946 family protein n=1 Tax=Hydrogenophaga crocea TaxID=2716225 RepID=A0A6G8IIP9_9BURK|nr:MULTISPECIES: DUF2946 family protein [Hydrogenophaga]MBL0944158.1 DUF2946 family protein [Hydrogenophaga sp.]QIM52850.1 DUF2946 family protein [Hydrogenophaga crocea]